MVKPPMETPKLSAALASEEKQVLFVTVIVADSLKFASCDSIAVTPEMPLGPSVIVPV